MEFRLLGPVEVRCGERPLALGGPKQRDLLTTLLLEAGRVVSVERLLDVLWDDAPPPTAVTALHGLVSRLRRVLDRPGQPSPVTFRAPGYVLDLGQDSCDLAEFERLADAGRDALAAGRVADAARLLHGALSLWRGPALGGTAARMLAHVEASRLGERRLATLERRIEADLELGRHAELVGELGALVAAHPLRERLRAQHMLALYRAGRQAEALASYREAHRAMVGELGLEPGERLRELELRILDADPCLQAPAVPSRREAPPAQLPHDIGDFTGRVEASGRVRELIAPAQVTSGRGTMVVAVYGKPGVGKSALTVRVAHEQRDRFPDGQLYAKLRDAQSRPADPRLVLGQWLRDLGSEAQAVPAELEARVRLYRGRLADRRTLVVLDDAVDEAQVRPLLPGGGDCVALLTSRRRLVGLEGARHVALEVLADDQALELLGRVAGEGRVAAEPDAARTIVKRCGGLPLALRICGARLAARPHWSLDRLAERLADERRRLDELAAGDLEVRASFALSYQALDDAGRRTVSLLGALDGPDVAPWLAAALLDVSLPRAEDLLEELAECQLLDIVGRDGAGQARFAFHDLLRAYARERLAAEQTDSEREQALARAQGALLVAAQRGAATLPASLSRGVSSRLPVSEEAVEEPVADPVAWFAAERDGIVAAVQQAAAAASAGPPAWAIAAAVAPFCELGMYWDTWRHVHEVALAAGRRDGDRAGEARARHGLGWLYGEEGRYDDAKACFEACLPELRRTGDLSAEASALHGLGEACWGQGHVATAITHLQRSLELVHQLDDEPAEARVLNDLAIAQLDRGRLAEAEASLARCLASWRRLGDQRGQAFALHNLGVARREAGRPTQAVACFSESLALWRAGGGPTGYPTCGLASAQRDAGRLDEARAGFEKALGVFCELGDRGGEAYARLGLGTTAHAEGHLAEAGAELERSLELLRALGDRSEAARAEHALGDVRSDQGRGETALAHLREAVAVTAELGHPLLELRARRSLARALTREGAPEAAAAERQRAQEIEQSLQSQTGGASGERVAIRGGRPGDDRGT